MISTIIALSLALGAAHACPDHLETSILKRQAQNGTNAPAERFWAYEQSYDWGRLNPDWELCQTGTQQSPIPLRLDQGLSQYHTMSFKYPRNTTGDFHNWGYGPAWNVDKPAGTNYSSLPSMTFDEAGKSETVYLAGWHIHSPADHTVQGDRSKAELHFVHADASGKYRAVVAFRIDPGNADSAFFKQLPKMIGFNSTEIHNKGVALNLNHALSEVNNFNDFWTYKGSLTGPPCTEGLRWFVARNILFVSDKQMQDILRVSTYSARAEQEVWRHDINV